MTINDDAKKLEAEIQAIAKHIAALPPDALNRRQRGALDTAADELAKQVAALDPVRPPHSVFDPSDSRLFGVFAAIALVGQDQQPLSKVTVDKIYGAGVYALYYSGENPIYAPIRDTETPIYVGKADPVPGARTPKAQGTKLSDRLGDHRKSIEKAASLSIDDFRCRRLVVASGWQVAAEDALIHLFKPIWNKQTRLLEGFGKHGDSADTRSNKRSPWDTLHPGRSWAAASREDAKNLETIEADLARHFQRHHPFTDAQAVIHELIAQVGAQEM